MIPCRNLVVIALGLALLWPLSSARASDVRAEDYVVAVVNQHVITRRTVLDVAQPMITALGKSFTADERSRRTAQIHGEALRAIIEEKLLNAEAERTLKDSPGLAPRVEAAVVRVIEKERHRAGGELALRDKIEKAGRTYAEYREGVRLQIMRDTIIHQLVRKHISVTPAEIRDHYRRNIQHLKEPGTVTCRQIFLRAEKYETPEKAREAAGYLIGLLKKQHDFARLVKEYSDGPYADQGGLWEPTRRGARPKAIDDLLFSLPVGQVGGPVKTDIGFTIVKVEDREPGRTIPFEEVQETLKVQILRARFADRYAQLIRRLERENYVHLVAPPPPPPRTNNP